MQCINFLSKYTRFFKKNCLYSFRSAVTELHAATCNQVHHVLVEKSYQTSFFWWLYNTWQDIILKMSQKIYVLDIIDFKNTWIFNKMLLTVCNYVSCANEWAAKNWGFDRVKLGNMVDCKTTDIIIKTILFLLWNQNHQFEFDDTNCDYFVLLHLFLMMTSWL